MEFAEAYSFAASQFQSLQARYQDLFTETEKLKLVKESLEEEFRDLRQQNRKSGKLKVRTARLCDIRGRYLCLFKKCGREYGSELALNHHMRTKHNAGTKTERQSFGRQIVMAESRGLKPPVAPIEFPPGYLEQLKKEIVKT